jgi:hypothetical protein
MSCRRLGPAAAPLRYQDEQQQQQEHDTSSLKRSTNDPNDA